ncbi:MAG: phage holin family protein [Bacteroidetes bacterium]|nr:phage holin family protein [Bacteroidota bacterium]
MESRRLSDNFNELSENVRSYIRLQMDLLKVSLTEKLSLITSALLLSVIFFILFLFITLFISLAFIFWFREHAGPLYAGALIVAGFYLVLGVIVFLLKNRLFVDPLVSKISEILLEEDEDENN